MATANLSAFNNSNLRSSVDMKIGIVVSEWNIEITGSLLEGAIDTLKSQGTNEDNIIIRYVPGSFELPLGAQLLAEYKEVDAVICLGCVIQGETPHFEYVCRAVTDGIGRLNLNYGIPFIFGVLTTSTLQQAKDRSGGKHGNKGIEASVAAIKMISLQRELGS